MVGQSQRKPAHETPTEGCRRRTVLVATVIDCLNLLPLRAVANGKRMKTSAIRALKPNVTQEEAVRFFRSGIFSGVYWKIRRGPLQRIADAYVPFWVYQVRYEIGRARKTRFFALDAVHGELDAPSSRRFWTETSSRSKRGINSIPRLHPDAAEDLFGRKFCECFSAGLFQVARTEKWK